MTAVIKYSSWLCLILLIAQPSVSPSLQITNRSFRYASPYLPSSFRQPHSVHSAPGSPHPAHITSSQYLSSFSPSVTLSAFNSRIITHLLHKSFPPSSSTSVRAASMELDYQLCFTFLCFFLKFPGYIQQPISFQHILNSAVQIVVFSFWIESNRTDELLFEISNRIE